MSDATHWKKVRSVLAGGTIFALGLAGAVTLGGPAFAVDGSINPDAKGSIIVHKHESPNSGSSNNPGDTGAVDPAKNKPIADVVFEACLISGGGMGNVLAGDNSFWDAVSGVSAADLKTSGIKAGSPAAFPAKLGAYDLQNCRTFDPTAADGSSTLSNLGLGAYLVREVSAPKRVVTPSQPFIVTIPSPKDHENLNGGWVYDVNVFPKNGVADEPRKNIVDQDNQATNGVKIGDPITYQVATRIPALETASSAYEKFVMTDVLDARLTADTDPSQVRVGFGKLDPVDTSKDLVQGTDYKLEWTKIDGKDKLVVTFLDAGLTKLEAGKVVTVEFVAAANALGAIDNQAFVNVNDLVIGGGSPSGSPDGGATGDPDGSPSGNPDGGATGDPDGSPSGNPDGDPSGDPDGNPTNIVKTRWGGAKFIKVDEQDPSITLAGAEFEVYMSDRATAGCDTPANNATLTKVLDADGSPYTVTSKQDGAITIPGLWVGDTELEVDEDGWITEVPVAGHDFTTRCYVLVETKAPAGYVLEDPKKRVEFVVDTGKAVQLGGTDGAIETISNKQQDVPELPLTGGSGQLILILSGAGILAIAIGAAFMARRRKEDGAIEIQ